MIDDKNDSVGMARAPRVGQGADPLWATAWAWVRRQHELMQAGDPDVAPRELIEWLAADPVHRQTYDEAAAMWLAVGLLPPDEDGAPPDER
jgi:ferric-dicitrate binding protein FerR (iron transport regulator)